MYLGHFIYSSFPMIIAHHDASDLIWRADGPPYTYMTTFICISFYFSFNLYIRNAWAWRSKEAGLTRIHSLNKISAHNQNPFPLDLKSACYFQLAKMNPDIPQPLPNLPLSQPLSINIDLCPSSPNLLPAPSQLRSLPRSSE